MLLVEDHQDFAEMLQELLSLSGHSAAIAPDGLTALRQAPVFQPDLILLDLNGPERDGLAVAGALRAALPPQVALVALSDYTLSSERARTLAAGFDRQLDQPLDLDDFERLVADTAVVGYPK